MRRPRVATPRSAALSCTALLSFATACPKEPERPGPVKAPRAKAPAQEQAAAPVAPSPALELALSVEQGPDGVGLRVINRGPQPADLHADVRLDGAQDGDYRQLNRAALTLRNSCATQGCVKLASFGELVAPSHLGLVEGERCDRPVLPPQPGRYRLRVSSCDGTHSAAVEFTWRPE